MKRSALATALIFWIVGWIYGQPFVKQALDWASVSAPVLTGMEWIDMNHDGALDAFQVYGGQANIYIRQGLTFTKQSHNLSGLYFSNGYFVLKDYDGDEDIDFIIYHNEKIRLGINDGNFQFDIQDLEISFLGTEGGPIYWIDIDGDLDLDIIVSDLIFMSNNGSYTRSLYTLPKNILRPAWGDVNNDGLVDILTAVGYDDHNDDALHFFINLGDGKFVEQDLGVNNFFGTYILIQWLDVDADQDLDALVVAASFNSPKSRLLKNLYAETGQIEWQSAFAFDIAHGPTASVGDVNLDGLPDIVISGYLETTNLYMNSSGGGTIDFAKTDLGISANTNLTLQMLDIDGDNDLDIHFRGINTNVAPMESIDSVFVNNTTNTRPAPSIPTGMNTLVTNDITLTWDGQPGLLYNIELKKDGQVIKSALSLSDGRLLNPGSPSMSMATTLILPSNEAGDYMWRLEAVDYAHHVSGFTGYQSFSIQAGPSNLVVTQISLGVAKLEWVYDDLSTSFAIFRRSYDQGSTEIAQVEAGIFSFVDAELELNGDFEYYVKAIALDGAYSAPSNIGSVFTGQYLEIPFGQQNPNLISVTGAVADIDQDEDFDFEFVGRIDSQFGSNMMLQNDGAGNFNSTSFLPGTDYGYPYHHLVKVKDIDNDGDEDVIVALGNEFSWMRLGVFLNESGTFVKGFQTPEFLTLLKADVEDFNNDGLPDLLLYHAQGNNTGSPLTYDLYYQTREGNFILSEFKFSSEAKDIGSFELADINSDGFVDIFFFGGREYEDSVNIFMNVNGHVFSRKPPFSKRVGFIKFLDADGDGIMDCLLKGSSGSFELKRGLGNWKFDEPVTLAGNFGEKVNIGDFDLDGLPDLLVCDNYNTFILKNSGNGNFESTELPFRSNWGSSTLLTDVENDGDIDILKFGNDNYHQGLNYLYKNQFSSFGIENDPPTAPGTITSTIYADHTTFNWSPSQDDKTSQKLLSYNLWIKDSEGKTWLHPETNLSGTFRRRLGPGNAGYQTVYTVNDLPAGYYTAQVQAIDASYKLSAWSPENEFSIIEGPTNLQVSRIHLNKVNLSWLPSSFEEQTVVVERKSTYHDYEIIAELEPGSTNFIDDGLEYNTVYTYRVSERTETITTASSNLASWNTNQWVIQTTNFPNIFGSLSIGDFTEDGRMDMVMNGARIYNGVSVDITKATFDNAESGWVKRDVIGSAIAQLGKLDFFDMNGDYRLDLFQSGYMPSTFAQATEVFINNGDKSFTSVSNAFTTNKLVLESVYDFDSDNDLDIFVTDNGLRKLMENKGSGVYQLNSANNNFCQNNCLIAVGAGDYDNDGDVDIFRFVNGHYQLFLSTANGFKASVIIENTLSLLFKAIDFNDDGWLDVVVATGDNYNGWKSRLYKNNGLSNVGELSFELLESDLPYGNPDSQNMIADFDHDGDDDLITISPNVNLYNNEGGGLLSSHTLFREYRITMNNAQLIDFDNDGDLDVYFAGYVVKDFDGGIDDPKSRVMLNQTIVNGIGAFNQPPTQPTNLAAYQDSTGMHLSWNPSLDDHTPSATLSYDVILYADGKAITGAAIDPLTGQRKTLAKGHHNGSALVRNLSPGNYRWRVQAVDKSFERSGLSEEGSFLFVPQQPTFEDTTIYRCGRTVTLTAGGEGIEWYSDRALTNKIATGEFHPTTSQNVFVVQIVNGIKGLPKYARVTIIEKPEKPAIVGNNPKTYCEQLEGVSTFLQANGSNVKWYANEEKSTLIGTGLFLIVIASQSSYYATQTLSNCESDGQKVDVKPIIIDSDIYYAEQKIYTRETEGDHYAWSKNNFLFYGGPNHYVDYNGETATYKVQIQKGQCFETSPPFAMSPARVTAIDPNIGSLIAYPNPVESGSKIHIALPGPGKVKIYDMKGNLMYWQDVDSIDPHTISTVNWNSGLYHLSFDNGQVIIYNKFIVR